MVGAGDSRGKGSGVQAGVMGDCHVVLLEEGRDLVVGC